MEDHFTFDSLDDDVPEIYPDNTLFAYDGKGKAPLESFTLDDINEIDLNPLIDDPPTPKEKEINKSSSKKRIIPIDLSSKSETEKSKYVKAPLFSECMDIQNKNNTYFNDLFCSHESRIKQVEESNIELRRRSSALETIVVDQDRELNIIKNKSKNTDIYLKDTFEKINKNNHILGQLIKGNTDMINHKFFDMISDYKTDTSSKDPKQTRPLKRKYNRTDYKKIRDDVLEKQRIEIAEKEKERKETALLSEKVAKELEDDDTDEGVRVSKRLRVKKIVEEQIHSK